MTAEREFNMFYYAVLEPNVRYAMSFISSDTQIVDDNHIAITETEYNEALTEAESSLWHRIYNSDGTWGDTFYWSCTTNEIQQVGNDYSLTTLLDGMEETIASKASSDHTHSSSDVTGLSAVATSGSYNDLDNKPSIPEAYTHPETHPASMITGLPTALPANGGNADTVDGKHATDFATANHNHDSSYATISALGIVETAVNGKASASHTHSQYAETTHNHDSDYAAISHTHAQSEVTGLTTALAGKASASHTHSEYASTSHNHDTAYSDINHDHNTEYAATSHTHTLDGVSETTSKKIMTADERTKLSGIAEGANAYIHPTYTAETSGLYKVAVDSTGHVSGATAVTKSDITALGIPSSDTTYSAATTNTAGLMSAADKTKLDGVEPGANAYTLPTASTTLGGVKTTSTVTSASGYTACPIIAGVPYYKDTNTTYSLSSFGVTATAAELNKLDGVTATATELNYVDGVTSNIQTQLNGKASSSHTHSDYSTTDHTHTAFDSAIDVNGAIKSSGVQVAYHSGSASILGSNSYPTTIGCSSSGQVTINGAKISTGSIVPRATSSYQIGNASLRYNGIYLVSSPNVSSDRRLKENIVDINGDEAAKLIEGLNVCNFNYIGSEEAHIGVIAQDIMELSPEMANVLVTEGEDGYYGVQTTDLIFPLISYVQKLKKEIEELKAEK